VIAQIADGPLINDLRKNHDVVVYRFDQEPRAHEVAALPKWPSTEQGTPQDAAELEFAQSLRSARRIAAVAGGSAGPGCYC
jgi:hypothetical protein